MADGDLKALLEEHLAPLGPIVIRRMFGGAGVFLHGLMLGLIADGALYLKADDTNRPDFEREACEPFSYTRKGGRATVMSYWQVPERLLDDPDALLAWARKAHSVALRAATATRPRKRSRGSSSAGPS